MARQVVTNYTVGADERSVTLTGLVSVDKAKIVSIRDTRTNKALYLATDADRATLTGKTLALPRGTRITGPLTIVYDAEYVPVPPVPGPTAAELSAAARPLPAPVDEAAIAERVLAEVQSQLDRMLEVRLREALAPALVRTADALVRDARREIVAVLREAVDRAIQDARSTR